MKAERLYPLDEVSLERFKSKYEVSEEGCWVWKSPSKRTGYGGFFHGKTVRAHRVAYKHYKGEIPRGLEIDHLCRNKACVNPDHLEAVTHTENVRRASVYLLTTCKQGHELSPENTRIATSGQRVCKVCARGWNSAYKQRERAKRTHCGCGRELSGENLKIDAGGRRRCMHCMRANASKTNKRRSSL